jgi:ferritin
MEEKIVMEDGRFRKNFNIEYSNYLTLLYGYEEPRDYSDEVSKTIAKWNRVIARYKANALDPSKKITDLNKSAREEIEMSGHDFNEILTNFVEEQTEEE